MSYMDEYNKLKKKRLEQEIKASVKTTSSGGSSYMNEYNKLKGQRDSTAVLKNSIRQSAMSSVRDKDEEKKKKTSTQAKTNWAQYLEADDYSSFSKPTDRKSKVLNLWKFWETKEDRGDDKYDFINNLDNYRDTVKLMSGGTGQKDMYGDYTKYSYMSEENIGIYNYLYATQGKDKAEEYLKDIEEDLNKSFGTDLYDNQTAVGKAINWLPAGMENWTENVKQFLSNEERPTSPYAYQSQLIQSEAEQKSPVLGLLHEAGLTASNQIPNLILTQGVGTLAQAAGWGVKAINAATKATSAVSIFTSSSGSAYKDALQEGRSEDEARTYSTMVGALEAGLSYAIGGIEGMTGVGTDRLLNKAATIKNSLLRNIAKHGIRIGSEIGEEELQLFAEPLVKAIVFDEEYDAPTIDEMVRTALVTAISTGAMNTVSDIGDGGRVNGLTVNEANVVEKVYQDEITKRKSDGKKLTAREKNKIYDDVVKQMEQGRIDTDTIESVLGGESYEGYKSLVEQETSLKKEIEALENTPETQFTVKQRERLTELREQLESLDTKTAKSNLFSEVDKLTANDTKLRESYNEKARRGQAFEADLTKYDAKQQETIKKAVESGILNNTNRTHEFVDLVAKISADKGVLFDFTNNQKLKESGFAIDGKQVNGFVTKDGITVNVNSAKSLDTVVGHEITHVLEGTELYNELQTAIVEYAKSKGDYQGRYDALTKLYENVEGANIDSELTAELVGDYIFTDTDFINNLSTNNRNVFQKIYDEVKYMLKVATAGSKEARELERVKKVFEEAYRNSEKAQVEGTKYALEQVDGINYVKTEKNTFLKEDGTVASEKEVFDNLVGKTISLPDGDVKIVKNLPGKRMYKELFNRYPKHLKDVKDVKQLNSDVNYNMEELLSNSEMLSPNEPDVGERHKEQGVVGFDTRNVNFYDGTNAYNIELSIATLSNGEKVAYAKKFFGYDNELTKKIQATETRGFTNTPMDQQPVNVGQSVKSDTIPTDTKIAQKTENVNPQYSLSDSLTPTQAQLTNIFASNIVSEAKKNNISLEQYYTATAEINAFSPTKADAVKIADALDPIVNQLGNDNFRGYLDKIRSYSADMADTDINLSLSEKDAAPTGKFLGKDIALETDPVTEATDTKVAEPDIAPVAEAKVEDYAPGESLEEQLAKADEAVESLDSEIEALFRDYSEQKISDEDFAEKWKDLDQRSTQARQVQEKLSAEMTDINNRKYESLDDSDIPPEMEAPYPGEPNPIAPVDPFADRDMVDVGKRNVKAYMYENPEVKPFFQDAARGMLYDIDNGTKGERIFNEQMHYESGYEKGWMGTKRRTTKDIADLLDYWGYSYAQIEEGLNAIIEGNGKENNAVSKRIEFMLDNRLRNGYKDAEGRPIPKNDEYINLLKEKQIDEYRSHFFDGFMEVADQYAPPVEDIAPLKIEPAIEGEQNVLDEFEQTEQAQTEQAPERLTRAKLHSQIVDRIKSVFTEKGIDFDKVLDDAHRMNALSINDNTPQRVNDKTFGYEAGELLNELTFNRVALDESNGIKWENEQVGTLRNLSKKYKIKPRTKEAAAVQMYAEGFWVNEKDEIIAYGDAELAKDFPDVQVQNRIKALANDPTIRQIYDNTLSAINESRRRNGYPEIPRLDNYFLHYRAQTDTFSQLGVPFNPNDIKAKDLPTDINGTTIDRKPGQPFFASSMHREGKRTTFDVFDGLERYIHSAKNQIYHIDNIQTARALWGYIADRYGQAHGLENLNDLELEAQQEHIQKVYDGHLSNYARFLVEYANNLAGKTALIDRGVEGLIGRRALQFINTVNTQTGRNQVGYSISSPLTNIIPSMEAIARTSKQDSIKAFAQTVSNVFRKDGFVESDPTLIRRKGADKFSKTLWEKMSDPGYILMGGVDNVVSEFIVRTKYNELTRKGMDSKQAHIKAGEWASRVMGDRSLGQTPLLYNSKFMGLFTKYQLEVRNQLDSAFYDNIQEIKASTKDIENQTARNAKTAAKIASKTLQIAVLNHVFGMAFEKIAGYNPAFDIISTIATLFGWDDDEDDEDTFGDNAEQAFKELLGDLPYTSLITDGGRIPVGSAMPIKQLVTGVDKYGNEKSRLETIAEAAPYYLLPGGYSQIKKTTQGLSMFSEEHPVSGSYTDSGNLRFPVEKTFGNVLQAGLFGQYASENARDYFDNERKPLKEKQIQEYIDVELPIKDYWEYREGLAKQDTLEDKFDYIAGLDLPVEKKNILINNIVDRKEEVDLEGYEDFSDYEEFDFAIKHPEKWEFMQANNISYNDYNASEESREAYSWAAENPEKYVVSKAVSDDVVTYRHYTGELSDIRADKDSNGKTISGSAKAKKFEYIESLPLDYGQKCILFKSQYKADDSMNMDIIEYLDSREDISYEEMVTILKELDFTVNGNNVYWD